jgi:hypothetical protein
MQPIKMKSWRHNRKNFSCWKQAFHNEIVHRYSQQLHSYLSTWPSWYFPSQHTTYESIWRTQVDSQDDWPRALHHFDEQGCKVRLIAKMTDRGLYTILMNKAVRLVCDDPTYGPRLSNCWLPAATWGEALLKTGHIDASLFPLNWRLKIQHRNVKGTDIWICDVTVWWIKQQWRFLC